MPKIACSVPSGNGGASGVPSTRWRPGGTTGVSRPGSASSGAGNSVCFRWKSTALRYRDRPPAFHLSASGHSARGSPRLHGSRGRRGEGLLEVDPELVRVLEPDGEPQQPGRAALAFPAMTGLDLRARSAEARRVLDQAHGALDAERRLSVGDVERDEPAQAGVADDRHVGMAPQPLGEVSGGGRLPRDPQLERLETA